MGCGQSTSEELDTSHSFLPKPINLAVAAHWSSCLAPAVCSFFFFLLHFRFIPSAALPLMLHTHSHTHAALCI